MYYVCTNCGEWEPNKELRQHADNAQQADAICPLCGHAQPFSYLPLYIVSGASGAGKTTACEALVEPSSVGNGLDLVVLDSDILWGVAYTEPDEWPSYFDMWLRVCYNIHQSGRSVMLFGAGLNPGNLGERPAHRYFSSIHYLGLVCEGEELARRLRTRPQWRGSGGDESIQAQVDYNQWFIDQSEAELAPMNALYTDTMGVEETVTEIWQWARSR